MSLVFNSLPIEIQSRDVAFLRGLFESRVMTLSHASRLYFDQKPEAAKKRVQKLKAAGLVRERPRQSHEPSILCLSKKGFELLFRDGHLGDYPRMTWEKLETRLQVSNLTLRHELAVMDVKAALSCAIDIKPSLKLVEFSTWPILFQFNSFHPATGAKMVVKPDAFVRLHETDHAGVSEHMFFVELDRSSESQQVLTEKILAYRTFYQQGGLAVRFGHAASGYREFPFRILVIFRSTERRNNAAVNLLNVHPPIHTFAAMTTLKEIESDPLGAIWIHPTGYLRVTHGTSFDPHKQPTNGIYRRQPDREVIVERSIVKNFLWT